MNFATHCKFCQKPITLEIDDAYAALGDPYKLLKKAACNECSDVRTSRRVLEERIGRVATVFAAIHRPGVLTKEETAKTLTILLQNYAQVIARWHHAQGMAWDDAAVDTIMENPNKWAEVLTNLWRMFRQWQAAQAKEQESRLL